jgi:hypothetical protein
MHVSPYRYGIQRKSTMPCFGPFPSQIPNHHKRKPFKWSINSPPCQFHDVSFGLLYFSLGKIPWSGGEYSSLFYCSFDLRTLHKDSMLGYLSTSTPPPRITPPPVEQAIVSYDSESERDDSSLSTESSSIWSWLSSLLPTSTAHLVQQQVEHRTKRQCCRADLLPCPIIDSPDGLVQQDGCFHYPEDRSVCLTRRATEHQDRVAQFLLQTRTKQQRYRAALLPCPIKARTCPRKARTNHCSVLETLPGGRAAPRASNTLDGGDPSNSSFTSSRISSISSSSSLGSSSSSLPKIREDKDASSDISVHTGDSTISTYNEFLRDSKSTYNDILPREDQSSSGAPELQQFVPPLTAPKQTNKVQEERPCAWKPTCLCQAK